MEKRRSSKTARSGAPAVFDVVGDVVSDALSNAVAVSNVVSEGGAVSGKGVESEGVVPGIVAALASDLPAHFEFGCGELRLGLKLAPRSGTVLGVGLDSMFVSGFETSPVPVFSSSFAPNFESDFAVVSSTAD